MIDTRKYEINAAKIASHDDETEDAQDLSNLPLWKSYLYRLQQQAPTPKPVECQHEVFNRPTCYGTEYHGAISRVEVDQLLSVRSDGSYLIRESLRAIGHYTLAIRFEGLTKNFRLYFDGQHFVGDKRFDTVQDLVADGLITFYLESKAADYIDELSSCSNYAESPYYRTYAYQKVARLQQQQRQQQQQQQDAVAGRGHSRSTREVSKAGAVRRLASVGSSRSCGSVEVESLTTSSGETLNQRVDERLRSVDNGQTRVRHTASCRQPTTMSTIADTLSGIPSSMSNLDSISYQRRPSTGTLTWCSEFMEVMGCEKPHIFKVHTYKGPHWCDYCANYLWGLIAQGFKCQDCGFNAHKRCSEKVPNDCLPDMKHIKRTFGVDLTTLVKAQNSLVPAVVKICIEEIESRGIEAQGLYRISGFHSDIEAVRMSFDKYGENTRTFVDRCSDIHTVACVLKLFFRMMPIPLITFDVYYKLIDCVSRSDLSLDNQLESIKSCLSLLPTAHLHTLKYLIAHLHRVSEQHRQNLMTSENLAIVFAPNLLRCPDTESIVSSGWSGLRNERDRLLPPQQQDCDVGGGLLLAGLAPVPAGWAGLKNERDIVELFIRHHDVIFAQ